MEGSQLSAMIGLFIGLAIVIMIGASILGGTVQNCETFNDYNFTDGAIQQGWAGSCMDSNETTQSAFALLVIVLIVVCAIIILAVIRLL